MPSSNLCIPDQFLALPNYNLSIQDRLRNFLLQSCENESDADKLRVHFQAVDGKKPISHVEKPRSVLQFFTLFVQKTNPMLISSDLDLLIPNQFKNIPPELKTFSHDLYKYDKIRFKEEKKLLGTTISSLAVNKVSRKKTKKDRV